MKKFVALGSGDYSQGVPLYPRGATTVSSGSAFDPLDLPWNFYFDASMQGGVEDALIPDLIDQSGNGNATAALAPAQATYKSNIVNGQSVARFNGTTNQYVRSLGPSNTYTLFFVTKGLGMLAGNDGYIWLQSDTTIEVYDTAGFPAISGFTALSSAFSVIALVGNGTQLSGYQNGVLVGTAASTGDTATTVIGVNGGSNRFNGDLPMMSYLPGLLSNDNFTAMQAYLLDRF